MSVSAELLCSFELLKPLDSSALKSHIKKGRNKRQQMLNSPVSSVCRLLAISLTQNSPRASSHRAFEALFILKGRSLHASVPRGSRERPAIEVPQPCQATLRHRRPFMGVYRALWRRQALEGAQYVGAASYSRRENRDRGHLLRPGCDVAVYTQSRNGRTGYGFAI